MKAADLCREDGFGEAAFYGWKQKFGGTDVGEAQRLKALEDKNRRLKLLVAEVSVHGDALEGVIHKRLWRGGIGGAVGYAQAKHALGERTAYMRLEVERSSYRHKPSPDRNAELRETLVQLVWQEPNHGYRWLHMLSTPITTSPSEATLSS